MDQPEVIKQLAAWLRTHIQDPSLEVKCDHATADKEEPAIYIEQKVLGEGRKNRIKQVDIAVVDKQSRKVKLVIEVAPSNEPVVPLGVLFSVILADVYVPSHQYSPAGDFKIEDCVVMYLTVVSGQRTKIAQFKQIERAVVAKLTLSNFGIKAIHLCHGTDDADAVSKCQEMVKRYLTMKDNQ